MLHGIIAPLAAIGLVLVVLLLVLLVEYMYKGMYWWEGRKLRRTVKRPYDRRKK